MMKSLDWLRALTLVALLICGGALIGCSNAANDIGDVPDLEIEMPPVGGGDGDSDE